LQEQGHDVVDYGYTLTSGEGAEYSATYARKVAHAIREEDVERGVLICGTGIGISISANKVRGIRAAVCSEPFTARHTRENNGSQIIAFGSFVVGPDMAKSIVDAFLGATFRGETDPEFVSRFNKIAAIEDEERAAAGTQLARTDSTARPGALFALRSPVPRAQHARRETSYSARATLRRSSRLPRASTTTANPTSTASGPAMSASVPLCRWISAKAR